MRAARLATIVALLLVTPVVATAAAKGPAAPAAPKGLHGFLLRPSEPVVHTFARDARIRLAARSGSRLLRVPTRDEPHLRRQHDCLVERVPRNRRCTRLRRRKAQHPGHCNHPHAPMVHGQAVRALRPRPCDHDAWRNQVEQLRSASTCAGNRSRPRWRRSPASCAGLLSTAQRRTRSGIRRRTTRLSAPARMSETCASSTSSTTTRIGGRPCAGASVPYARCSGRSRTASPPSHTALEPRVRGDQPTTHRWEYPASSGGVGHRVDELA